MKNLLFAIAFLLSCLAAYAGAQTSVPLPVSIQILHAEDARRYDAALEKLLNDPNVAIRKRAALAAGRIGDDKAIPALTSLMLKDRSEDVRAMIAFALGEIESIKAADAILKELNGKTAKTPSSTRVSNFKARLIEAAGKIAAANPKEAKSKELGEAILNALRTENGKSGDQDRETILLALTAALRAKPDGSDSVVTEFLTNSDPRIRADAANTLARARAKNAVALLRPMLTTDADAIARANAARALGAAEDKDSFNALLETATTDKDSRVRVSAIRALGSLKDANAAGKLLERGEKLLADYKKSKFANPIEKNELLEIVTTLGRILPNTDEKGAVNFLTEFRGLDKTSSPETEIAFARIAPKRYVNSYQQTSDWKKLSAQYQGLAEIANLDAKATSPEAKMKARLILVQEIAIRFTSGQQQVQTARSRPDLIRAFAAFKSANASNIFRPLLENETDVFARAAIAEVLADQPASKENIDELKKAFAKSLITDNEYDDAQLAILDSLYKLDKKESVETMISALSAPDYLVRKKAFEMLEDKDLQKDFPGISTSLENARLKNKNQVLPHSPAFGTKLGQILNTSADYARALSRKNGSVSVVITTEKGAFTIDLVPEDAPLTVDNFIRIARSGYFNGVEVHRVVPNFVMQDGDPRGDGSGGPGWTIRCEINMIPYERGAVGMALSGKDTGGSQWFVTHSPQPHLDGGYTVFGKVNETSMKVVDSIVRGDKIINVRVVQTKLSGRQPAKH